MPEVSFSLSLIRADDLLALGFDFINLNLESGEGNAPRLVRIALQQPAFVLVNFPPQHIAEQVFPEDETKNINAIPPPVGSVLAFPSRLVFEVPFDVPAIPVTVEALLNWQQFSPHVAPNADPTNPQFELGPGPADPDILAAGTPAPFTSIELPYRLILSPGQSDVWQHSTKPVKVIDPITKEERSELWHTRLVRPNAKPGLRAIWARDLAGNLPTTVKTSMSSDDRQEIVRQSSDFSIPLVEFDPSFAQSEIEKVLGIKTRRPCYSPPPLEVERLFLSTLGGWLHVQGSWNFPDFEPIRSRFGLAGIFLQEVKEPPVPDFAAKGWRHIAGMGRDQYVRIVHKGFLCPFGHRASLILITERKFKSVAGEEVAYLAQRQFVVVQEPEKDYTVLENAYANQGREFPFKKIRITTLLTPSLDPQGPEDSASFPRLHNQPFAFHIVATGLDNQEVDFTLPLLFVPAADQVGQPFPVDQALNEYLKLENDSNRRGELRGQLVTFAEADNLAGSQSRNTVLKTQSISFLAQITNEDFARVNLERVKRIKTPALPLSGLRAVALRDRQLPFLPILEKVDVSIPAIDHLLGASGGSGATSISFNKTYLEAGFDGANKGQVFADILGKLPLNVPADKAGGLAAPNMNIEGLSRHLGPVPDVKSTTDGKFDAAKVFSGIAGANLLGGITLGEIIAPDDLSTPFEAQLPKLTTTHSPDAVETILDWKPSIVRIPQPSGPPPNPALPIRTNDETTLNLRAVTHTPTDGSQASHLVTGNLTNFSLEFLNIIEVKFASLAFSAENAKKMDVSVAVKDVLFSEDGELAFLNQLQPILKQFGNQLKIDPTPEGVTVGYSLVIPTVGVGVFSFQDLALSTSLFIPFIDAPAQMRFAISKREHPFLVTVSLFGGGGFFALTANTRGDIMVEASIEFGGNIELDLIVAKGGVHVMAGIYFKMEGREVKITGFLRCGGHLEVLGLISVSVEFYMGLSYESNGKVLGEATLTVSVDVSFFSKSVSLHVERRFAGSAGDPTFDESITPGQWTDYCSAFA